LLVLGVMPRPLQPNPPAQVPVLFWILLLVGPLFSGASGATIRAFGPDGGGVTARNLVRGMAAGLVCAIFYLIAQLSGMATSGTVTFLTLLIEFLTAFLGGFTADRVLSQLSELRALREHALDQAVEGADQPGMERLSSKPKKLRPMRKSV